MDARLGSQAGIRQMAVYVQERGVMLPVADVGENEADDSAHKGVCQLQEKVN